MTRIRWSAVVWTAAVLVVAPVVTPAWAAPHPVTPSVHRTAISGVDATALHTSPVALDPAAGGSASSGTPSASNGGSNPGGGSRVAPTVRPAVFTAPLDTGRFTAAGVSWRPSDPAGSAKGVTVQVRVRERGTWSDWRVLDIEGGPDGGTDEARQQTPSIATQPYSSPDADGIQVRVDTPTATAPPELTLVTVDPGSSPADAALSHPASTAHSAAAQPTIVSRAGWGADESIRTCTPSSSATIKVGFVHHTAGSNSYRPEDSAGLVRGIYAYHVQGNGWCDIGYNFLVDRFGTRFEGRYGSLTQPIIGAHTLAFNRDSFAVSAMGDFTTAAAPAVMMTSINQILGWKLSLYGRDPHGTDTLTSGGGTGAKWPAGTVVRFNVVSGHRDAFATGCPGDVIYNQLGAVRDATAQYIAGNGASATTNAIDAYNATLGGRLGAATGPEVGMAGGAMRPYERGNIYWSASTGAHYVWGALLVKYLSLGGPSGFGFPTTDEVGVAGGARSSFTKGSLFWSQSTGAHLVWGAILARYDALGGPPSIGFPTTDEVGVAGGSRSTFSKGSLFWSDPTGTRLVWGGNLVKYDSLGGPPSIGFPTSDEVGVAGGSRQPFARGSLFWSAATGSRLVWGAILVRYDAVGGPALLGFPKTDEVGVGGGARQIFTNGSVFWTDRTAAHFVWGAILVAYDQVGGPAGDLGFPTSDEYAVPGGARNDFERGRYIDWTAGAGAVVH